MRQIWYYSKAAALAQRRMTARVRALPSVFILGATKAGSTTLTNLLWQHPAHVPPFTKELMYLQNLPCFRSNWEFSKLSSFLWGRYEDGHARYSVSGYRKFFPTRIQMWRRRRSVGRAVTSDCDPFNLYCEVATQRIAALAPAARLIISLRDPVHRAYSDFNMHRTRAHDTRSFAQAIDQELRGTERRFRKRFLNQSIYAPHIERWLKVFPREQILILRAENLFENSTAIAQEMFSFLELDPAPVNPAIKNRGTYAEKMERGIEEQLREYFHPFNLRLYELLGFDMGWGSLPHTHAVLPEQLA